MNRYRLWQYTKNKYINHIPFFVKKYKIESTKFYISQEDTLDYVIVNNIQNPLILIFADDKVPGGCIESNNGMQEESLFRRTALYKYMTPELYPLEENESIYLENVPVYRMSELRNNEEINERYYCFIASACRIEEISLELKIKHIIDVAIKHGHKDIILGAWGCGAFGLNAKEVAKIFKNVCSNYSLNFHFAILGKNYDIFKDVLYH